MTFEHAAYLLGLILGGVAILLVCSVYFRSHRIGPTGFGLALVGVMLIGLPLWAKVKLGAGEFSAEFDRRLADTEHSNKVLADELANVAKRSEVNGKQILDVSEVLVKSRVLPETHFDLFRENISKIPPVHSDSLQAISRRMMRASPQ